jgi:ferredoxin
MTKRKIIKIDEEKCNGCGLCIPNCPEGALQVIDGKARLISDLFCDGLGACIGYCPQGAISIEERETQAYNERKVMENIIKQGKNVIKAHLEHLKKHTQSQYLKEAIDFLKEKNIKVSLKEKASLSEHKHSGAPSGCPGSKMMDFRQEGVPDNKTSSSAKNVSQLRQWPVQIMLISTSASYLQDADLLIAADCVPFAYADFHSSLLKGKVLLVGCPKLDDVGFYQEKITQILKNNNVKSITCVHMEVPCCFGLVHITKEALKSSNKEIPFKEVTIGIKGSKR